VKNTVNVKRGGKTNKMKKMNDAKQEIYFEIKLKNNIFTRGEKYLQEKINRFQK